MNLSSRTLPQVEPIRRDTPERLGDRFKDLRLAVLIPCYNEAAAIEQVVSGFRTALPGASNQAMCG